MIGKKPSHDLALDAFQQLCLSVASPYSDKALSLLKKGDFLSLASLDIAPKEYIHPYSFALDYSVYAYLRKYAGFPASEDLRAKAISDFEKIEGKCLRINREFKATGCFRSVERYLSIASRKIQSLIGPFRYSKVLPGCDWGNGATSSIQMRNATLDQKLLERQMSVTPSCLRYAKAYIQQDIHWLRARLGPDVMGPTSLLRDEFSIVEDGRFATVPKTVKSLRSIDIQPTLNLFFQKGVGKYIRRRLQTCGIDLDDQSKNQYLASVAFSDGLATIDLASASDSISSSIVQTLIPSEWYEYLNDIRTKSISIDGVSRRISKFSAMGNGFTFELESLIFYAVCYAVREVDGSQNDVISVYGDDIIVSQSLAGRVIHVLEQCGFSVNTEKTFTTGPFYESCGKHFFENIEVTPVYQKEICQDVQAILRAANRLLRLSATLGRYEYLDDRCRGPRSVYVRALAFMKKIPIGPIWLDGDGFLKDPYFRPKADRNGIFSIREFVSVQAKRRLVCDSPLLATALRKGVVVKSPYNGFVAVIGKTRYVLRSRRVYLDQDGVLVWASTVAL